MDKEKTGYYALIIINGGGCKNELIITPYREVKKQTYKDIIKACTKINNSQTGYIITRINLLKASYEMWENNEYIGYKKIKINQPLKCYYDNTMIDFSEQGLFTVE